VTSALRGAQQQPQSLVAACCLGLNSVQIPVSLVSVLGSCVFRTLSSGLSYALICVLAHPWLQRSSHFSFLWAF
jgi:hypothetical protein